MIAAGLFTIAGVISASAVADDPTVYAYISMACWVVAALCGFGVIG